jgi:ribosomal protein L32
MTPKCPKCGSIIYSRRNVLCGVCGQRLPKELLFTEEERQVVDRDLEDLKNKAKQKDEHPPYTGGYLMRNGDITDLL